MKLSDCGLWIDVSLILNFKRPAAQSYRDIKVDNDLIEAWAHDSPYFVWLLGDGGVQREDDQLLRDGLFSSYLFSDKPKVNHRSGFDLAKLFEEAGGKVALASHESPEALSAIAAYCGFKNPDLFPLRCKASADRDFAKWDRSGQAFTYVLERGIHLGAERKIVEQLADKGIMLNVKSYNDLRTTVRGALHVISDKGFRDV